MHKLTLTSFNLLKNSKILLPTPFEMNWPETMTAESVILKAWLCLHVSSLAPVVTTESSELTDLESPIADSSINNSFALPLAINTWGFSNATESARITMLNGGSARDAVVAAGTRCEVQWRKKLLGLSVDLTMIQIFVSYLTIT